MHWSKHSLNISPVCWTSTFLSFRSCPHSTLSRRHFAMRTSKSERCFATKFNFTNWSLSLILDESSLTKTILQSSRISISQTMSRLQHPSSAPSRDTGVWFLTLSVFFDSRVVIFWNVCDLRDALRPNQSKKEKKADIDCCLSEREAKFLWLFRTRIHKKNYVELNFWKSNNWNNNSVLFPVKSNKRSRTSDLRCLDLCNRQEDAENRRFWSDHTQTEIAMLFPDHRRPAERNKAFDIWLATFQDKSDQTKDCRHTVHSTIICVAVDGFHSVSRGRHSERTETSQQWRDFSQVSVSWTPERDWTLGRVARVGGEWNSDPRENIVSWLFSFSTNTAPRQSLDINNATTMHCGQDGFGWTRWNLSDFKSSATDFGWRLVPKPPGTRPEFRFVSSRFDRVSVSGFCPTAFSKQAHCLFIQQCSEENHCGIGIVGPSCSEFERMEKSTHSQDVKSLVFLSLVIITWWV